MSRIASYSGERLSMRQTLALGLVMGLVLAVVHALTCSGSLTQDRVPGAASLPQTGPWQVSAPTASKFHHALYVVTNLNSLSAEREAIAGPRPPQYLVTRIRKVPGLLWRL
jgi:hypothetical protein